VQILSGRATVTRSSFVHAPPATGLGRQQNSVEWEPGNLPVFEAVFDPREKGVGLFLACSII